MSREHACAPPQITETSVGDATPTYAEVKISFGRL